MENLQLTKSYFRSIHDDFVTQSGLAATIAKEAFDREVSFALQLRAQNEYLMQCTPQSFLQAVLNVAQVGLTLSPVRKYAYLVPKRVGGEWRALLTPSYIGLCKLITDTGAVKSIQSNIIYEGDKIEIDLATNKISHTPYILTGKPKGEKLGVYSVAYLSDGTPQVELMSREEIETIRGRSDSWKSFQAGKAKSSIWDTDEGEMFRKTVIKRHYKYLPKSTGSERVESAVDLDNKAAGFDELPTMSQFTYANSLLRYVPEQKQRLYEKMINEAKTVSDMASLINEMNEMVPVEESVAPTDINKRVMEKVADESA